MPNTPSVAMTKESSALVASTTIWKIETISGGVADKPLPNSLATGVLSPLRAHR
jgi:hypothetical protein